MHSIFFLIFQKCLRNCLSGKDIKASAFSAVQAEFERAKGDVDSKRIFLDQSFRDCVTSDCKLDMEKCSDLVQLSIKGKIFKGYGNFTYVCYFNMVRLPFYYYIFNGVFALSFRCSCKDVLRQSSHNPSFGYV